jgi:hypothetical protein
MGAESSEAGPLAPFLTRSSRPVVDGDALRLSFWCHSRVSERASLTNQEPLASPSELLKQQLIS